MRITQKTNKESKRISLWNLFERKTHHHLILIGYFFFVNFLYKYSISTNIFRPCEQTHTQQQQQNAKKKNNTIICNVNKNNLIILDVTTLVFWFGLVTTFFFPLTLSFEFSVPYMNAENFVHIQMRQHVFCNIVKLVRKHLLAI